MYLGSNFHPVALIILYTIDMTNAIIAIIVLIVSYMDKGEIKMRIWGKIFKDNRLVTDTVITNDSEDSRTQKIFDSLDSMCYEMDLSRPIWLDSTIREFQRLGKCRFTADSFIEEIDFDYLEFHIIEE